MRVINAGLILFFLFGIAYSQKPEPVKTPLPVIQNAISLIQNQQLTEAEKLLRETVKKNPANVDAKFLLGTVLIQTNKPDEGIKFLDDVLKINPKHLQANYNLALIYSSRGDNKKAIPFLEKAAGIYPPNKTPKTDDIVLLTALTRAYIAEKRKPEAEKLIILIEKFSVQDIRILFTLGLIQAELGNYEKAAQIFENVNSQRPASLEVLYNLGIAYYNLDKLDAAQKVLLEAVNLNPNR